MNIQDIWNHRLSTATPRIMRSSGTWVCEIWAKKELDKVLLSTLNSNLPEAIIDDENIRRTMIYTDWYEAIIEKHQHLILETEVVAFDGNWMFELWHLPVAVPLKTYDTEIKYKLDDAHDVDKLKVCHDWFKSVRDEFSLPNIEELKPWAAEIRAAEDAEAKRLDTSQYTHLPIILLDKKVGIFICQIWTKDEQGNPKDLIVEKEMRTDTSLAPLAHEWFSTLHQAYDFPENHANIPIIPFKQQGTIQ